MGITKLSKSGFTSSSYEKYNDFLAGNTAFNPGNYESIATVTVGSGGSSTVTFSSIPSTYEHLQIRFIAKAGNTGGYLIQFNTDTTVSNYISHLLYGSGTAALSTVNNTISGINFTSSSTDQFSAGVIDILDYKNTNKNTTVRTLGGFDNNGSGFVNFYSGLWINTAAINSITIKEVNNTNLTQYSSFALYGIKGA